jgi:XPG I-region/XPG N-terminal domain
MHRIKMFRHYGVEPYVVFDGDYLPSKLHTEDSRASKRAQYMSAGMRYHAQGQSAKATEQFQKCIDITPEMAYRLILALRREEIAYVVAPYEADAQLAYLEKKGIIQAIVTEDSDLLVFGCRTLLLKMGQFGDCVEIKRERFANVTGGIRLHGFTDDDFRHMAILSGCDYLPNINGVGLITAHRLLRRFNRNVKRVQRNCDMCTDSRLSNRCGYRLELAFPWTIWIPSTGLISRLNTNGCSALKMSVWSCGMIQRNHCPMNSWCILERLTHIYQNLTFRDVDVDIARGVAKGELHPTTKQPLRLPKEDKANVTVFPFSPRLANHLKVSQGSSTVSSYKPKAPTPVKSKSITSFFSGRSKSPQDITEQVTKRDAEKANIPTTRKSLFRPQPTMKRAFTVVGSEERLAVKRARKYLGEEDEDTPTVQSPFFAKAPQPVAADKVAEDEDMGKENEEYVEALLLDENPEEGNDDDVLPMNEIMAIADSAEESDDDILPVDEPSTIEEATQVQESPPRIHQQIQTDDEIIPDSPSNPTRTRPLSEIQSFIYKPTEPQDPLPSPPPSRPSLPTPSTRPILRPGMSKKPYTPRPSGKRDVFPDTPTPSPQQALLIQSWKEHFTHSLKTARPLTPTTPKPRAKPLTPGVGRPASHSGLKLASLDQIEVSPPTKRPSTGLGRSRFIPT